MGKIFDALQKHKKEIRSDSPKSEKKPDSTASAKSVRKQAGSVQSTSGYRSGSEPASLDNRSLGNIHSSLSDSVSSPRKTPSQNHQDNKSNENQHDAAPVSTKTRTSASSRDSRIEKTPKKKPPVTENDTQKESTNTKQVSSTAERVQRKPPKPLKKTNDKVVFIKSSKNGEDPGPEKTHDLRTPVHGQALSEDQEHREADRLDHRLVAYWEPQSFISEQFKRLRTNLFFSSVKNPPRSILITSALSGDGKSFTAANLAISIAQNINEHVLLIDCDLRRPQIQNLFGLPETNGLSDYLSRDVDLSDLLKKTVLPKLSILSSGPVPPNPAELLSSQKMRALLHEVKNRYADRYIILDSPPPQLTVETKALAAEVDGILMVIKSGASHSEMVKDAVEYLGKEKILGVVFNNFDERSGLFNYGKKGRYYKYYKYE